MNGLFPERNPPYELTGLIMKNSAMGRKRRPKTFKTRREKESMARFKEYLARRKATEEALKAAEEAEDALPSPAEIEDTQPETDFQVESK